MDDVGKRKNQKTTRRASPPPSGLTYYLEGLFDTLNALLLPITVCLATIIPSLLLNPATHTLFSGCKLGSTTLLPPSFVSRLIGASFQPLLCSITPERFPQTSRNYTRNGGKPNILW